MKISKCATSITPSLTRELYNKAQEIGADVIDLTLGDPDLMPPEEIRHAACNAINAGKTRYSANAGLKELRESYASFFARNRGIAVSPDKNIIACVGGMEALFLSIASLVDDNDEVIILEPYYVNYYQMISMCGGIPITINSYCKSDDEIINNIRDAITDNTVGIIINSPCNPTGTILSPVFLDMLADLVCKKELFVISDEVYNSLVYDGKRAESIYSRPGMKNRAIIIDSCSKRFAMTGWRIGFAIGPEEVIANMTKMQENVAACAPLPSQYAAVKAYREDFDYSYIKKEYQRRRDYLTEQLGTIKNLKFNKPDATFYCFIDVSETGLNALEFAYRLLDEQHVAVVPGIAYGEHYANYIRIAFTLNQDKLEIAVKRIQTFCGEFLK